MYFQRMNLPIRRIAVVATMAVAVLCSTAMGAAASNVVSYIGAPQSGVTVSSDRADSSTVAYRGCLAPNTQYSINFNTHTAVSEAVGVASFRVFPSVNSSITDTRFTPAALSMVTGEMTTPSRVTFDSGPEAPDPQNLDVKLEGVNFSFDNSAARLRVEIRCVLDQPGVTTPSDTSTVATGDCVEPTWINCPGTTAPTNTSTVATGDCVEPTWINCPGTTAPTTNTERTATDTTSVRSVTDPTNGDVVIKSTVSPTSSAPVTTNPSTTTITTSKNPDLSQCNTLKMARGQAWSAVSKWAGGKTRIRLETKAGAYIYRSRENKAQILLKSRGIDNRRARVKKVVYFIDGAPASTVVKAPWALLLKPKLMTPGRHEVTARVETADKSSTAKLAVYLTDCQPKRYTFAMSSKLRRAHPNLRLWWQAGDAFPTQVTANIPREIQVRSKQLVKYKGRVLGGIQVSQQDGTKHYVKLRVPDSIPSSGRVVLLSELSGMEVVFDARTGGKIKVTGIPEQVNQVRVWLRGKSIKLFQNIDRCESLYSTAEMKDLQSSLKIIVGAKLCSNKR